MTTRPPWDPRNTAAWQKLSAQVITQEPTCWLQLPGCTIRSTTADHIIGVPQAPHLALDRRNLHGACRRCNTARGNTPIEELPALRARMLNRRRNLAGTFRANPAANALRFFRTD